MIHVHVAQERNIKNVVERRIDAKKWLRLVIRVRDFKEYSLVLCRFAGKILKDSI